MSDEIKTVEELAVSQDKVRRKLFAELGELKKKVALMENELDHVATTVALNQERVKWHEGDTDQVIVL